MIIKYKEVKMDEFFRRKIIGVECGCNLEGDKIKIKEDGIIVECNGQILFSLYDGTIISKCPFCEENITLKKVITLDLTSIIKHIKCLKEKIQKQNPTKLSHLEIQQYLYDTGKIAAFERDTYERIEEFLKEE